MDSDIYGIFIQEAMNHIVKINDGLLAIESEGPDSEKLQTIKSEVHTLKGDSRMLGFQSISQAAHRMEDYTAFLENAADDGERKKSLKILFSIMDAIEKAVQLLPGEKIEIDLSPYPGDNPASSPKPGVEPAPEVPPPGQEPAEVKPGVQQSGTQRVSHDKVVASDYINIKLAKIESLVQVSSAFPRYSSRFNFILGRLREIEMQLSSLLPENRHLKVLEELNNEFSHELAFYDLASKQFQDEVTKLKLVPLATIFQFFPRLVRDVAKNTGKEVNFSIVGNDVELDKFIVENFKNILIHILRNAVDHGIEDPGTRGKVGKSTTGRVHLSAVNKGDNVLVEVSDDGKGLDIEKIRSKALEKGLITRAEAADMPESEITSLIFSSGFTTKTLGDFSGRGVGMDSVARALKDIGGEISVRTVAGKGATFSITLPLVSSYIPITIFTLGERLYGIPSTYVEIVMLVKKEQIKREPGDDTQMSILINNHDISLIDLRDVFGLGKSALKGSLKLIICRYQDEISAFIVSDVIMEKKLIISRVSALADKLNIILGGVLLGMERIIPVLNIPPLFARLKSEANLITRIQGGGEAKFDIGFKNILLVEDSLVTRTSEKKILLKQNFNVYEAANGKEALEILEKTRIDCILSDIEMPIMNGVEFITRLKSNARFCTIPVIVVSSYKNYNEKLAALKINHFINKGEFNKDLLIKTLREVNVV